MTIPLTPYHPRPLSARRPTTHIIALLLTIALLLSACASPSATPASSTTPTTPIPPSDAASVPTSPTHPLPIVAANPLLADLARHIGGPLVSVHSLVPFSSDLHTWQSTPQDSIQIANARLIIRNGADLATHIDSLFDSAASPSAIHIIAAQGLTPQKTDADDHDTHDTDDHDTHDTDDHDTHDADARDTHDTDDHDAHDADDHDADTHDTHDTDDHDAHHHDNDPHFWQNPLFTAHYVNQITNGLIDADPDNADRYLDNSAAYLNELDTLDRYISDTLSSIPSERRLLVTFHDAFGYFGARYDLEVIPLVGVHGGGVSPDDIVQVLNLVDDHGLPAIFAEPQFSDDALNRIAHDTGIQVGIIRSLPDASHPDYISMMRANADALAELLQ